MDMRKFALQEWLKAEDLPDGGQDVTITDVYSHVFPPGPYSDIEQEKTVLVLVEFPFRPCPLSPTTTTTVVALLGPDGEDWKGKRIRLDKSKLANGKFMIVAGPVQETQVA